MPAKKPTPPAKPRRKHDQGKRDTAANRASAGILRGVLEAAGFKGAELRDMERQIREEVVASVSKAEWIQWSGSSNTTLRDYAGRHGMPVGSGRPIEIPAVARWIHKFIAENRQKLAIETSTRSPVQDEIAKEELALKRYKRQEIEGVLIPRATMRDLTTRLASLLRGAGDRLQRRFGNDARAVLDEALDAFEKELDRLDTP